MVVLLPKNAGEDLPLHWGPRYVPLELIGQGGFGKVYRCLDVQSGAKTATSKSAAGHSSWVAIKAIPLRELNDAEVAMAMSEISLLQNLEHPNVLRFVDFFMDEAEQQLCMVTEYVDGGDVASLIHKHHLRGGRNSMGDSRCIGEGCGEASWISDPASFMPSTPLAASACNGLAALKSGQASRPKTSSVSWRCSDPVTTVTSSAAEQGAACASGEWIDSFRITDIVRQCLDALAYLHSLSIIHRDIKPANVYLCRDGTVKLGDFGVCKLLDAENPFTQTFIGTPFYLSPELCLGEPYSFGTDVWALGVLTYELYCLTPPFSADNVLGQIHVVTEGTYDRARLWQSHTFEEGQLRAYQQLYGDDFLRREKIMHAMVASMVERMLVADPAARPTAEELLADVFGMLPSFLLRSRSSGGGGALSPYPSRPVSRCVFSLRLSAAAARLTTPPLPPPSASDKCSIGSFSHGSVLPSRSALFPAVAAHAEVHNGGRPPLAPARRLASCLPLNRQAQPNCLPCDAASADVLTIVSDNDDAGICREGSTLSDAIRSDTRPAITDLIGRVPWLLNADAFSALTLHAGSDGVLMVERGGAGLVSFERNSNAAATSRKGSSLFKATDVGHDVSRYALRLRDSPSPFRVSLSVEGDVADSARGALSSQPPPLLLHLQPQQQCLLALEEHEHSARAQTLMSSPLQPPSLRPASPMPSSANGRCRGVPGRELERLLRVKLRAHYARRHQREREQRETWAQHEARRAQLRRQLNALYAEFYEKSAEALQQRHDTRADSEATSLESEQIVTQLMSPVETPHCDMTTAYYPAKVLGSGLELKKTEGVGASSGTSSSPCEAGAGLSAASLNYAMRSVVQEASARRYMAFWRRQPVPVSEDFSLSATTAAHDIRRIAAQAATVACLTQRHAEKPPPRLILHPPALPPRLDAETGLWESSSVEEDAVLRGQPHSPPARLRAELRRRWSAPPSESEVSSLSGRDETEEEEEESFSTRSSCAATSSEGSSSKESTDKSFYKAWYDAKCGRRYFAYDLPLTLALVAASGPPFSQSCNASSGLSVSAVEALPEAVPAVSPPSPRSRDRLPSPASRPVDAPNHMHRALHEKLAGLTLQKEPAPIPFPLSAGLGLDGGLIVVGQGMQPLCRPRSSSAPAGAPAAASPSSGKDPPGPTAVATSNLAHDVKVLAAEPAELKISQRRRLGTALLPRTLPLLPLHARTRLSGVVWRVKRALQRWQLNDLLLTGHGTEGGGDKPAGAVLLQDLGLYYMMGKESVGGPDGEGRHDTLPTSVPAVTTTTNTTLKQLGSEESWAALLRTWRTHHAAQPFLRLYLRIPDALSVPE